MAIYTHNYSAIILKGLGGAACCALLTANFGLNCGCSIEVVIPPPINTGGGGPVGGFFVPFPKKLEQRTRLVLVTVKFSREMAWRRSYVVDVSRSDMIVKVINIVNSFKDGLSVGVDKIRTAGHTVMAIFNKE